MLKLRRVVSTAVESVPSGRLKVLVIGLVSRIVYGLRRLKEAEVSDENFS